MVLFACLNREGMCHQIVCVCMWPNCVNSVRFVLEKLISGFYSVSSSAFDWPTLIALMVAMSMTETRMLCRIWLRCKIIHWSRFVLFSCLLLWVYFRNRFGIQWNNCCEPCRLYRCCCLCVGVGVWVPVCDQCVSTFFRCEMAKLASCVGAVPFSGLNLLDEFR